MKILVTGGAGFIGSNYIERLLREHNDVKVVCLDKMTYAGNSDNLAFAVGDSRFTFYKADIADAEAVDSIIKDERPDVIVNFAAESHVDRSIADSTDFVRSNVTGVQVLLDAARRYGNIRFHQISTDEVYGDLPLTGGESFSEESPLRPSSPYSATKAAADMLVLAYHRTYGLPVTISRSSNNYGKNQYPEKLIPLAVDRICSGLPVPVYGNGLNVRDWIAVEDHCAAIEAVINAGKSGCVYNVGGGNELSNLELVDIIISILGGKREFVPDRAGHDRRYSLNTEKARRELGWRPNIDFAVGIKRTVLEYAKKR